MRHISRPHLSESVRLSAFNPSPESIPLESDKKGVNTMDHELPRDTMTDATRAVEEAEPDPQYHMEMVVFKVEDALYRVPTHLFRSETTFFDGILDAPSHGSSEKNLVCDDVAKADFRALLKFLYPITFTLVRTLSDSEWISVLKVSTKWSMLEIRHLAIEHLSSAPLALVDRIVLAKECFILSWLRSAYLTLMDAKSELSHYDIVTMEKLGLESSFKLHCAREFALPRRAGILAMRNNIDEEFEAELETLDDRTAIERAVLAQTYNVSEWRQNSFIELVERSQAISVEEAQVLGYQAAIRLCTARERQATLGVERAVHQELAWDFRALNSHTAVERLVLARGHAVRVWVRDALCDLGESSEPLSASEAATVGLNTAIALCRARHDPDQPSPGEAAYALALEREFQGEFMDIEVMGNRLLSKSEREAVARQRLEEKRLLEDRRLKQKYPEVGVECKREEVAAPLERKVEVIAYASDVDDIGSGRDTPPRASVSKCGKSFRTKSPFYK
ncbi:hypothetical protein DXG01_003175 [Tephrocybe rancida]|nr:hypothetical protein DXG01_003175 [Tephrocybe rancida]